MTYYALRTAVARGSCLALVAAALPLAAGQKPAPRPWQERFEVGPASLATTGRNPYFVLEPGYQLTLEGREDGQLVRLVMTVLDETKVIGGVETRVVEERETQGGALAEVSRNYLAVDKGTGALFYFGEDVDTYKNGKVVGHEGTWHHGFGGAKFGMMLPGTPAVGMRYYQEQASEVALDRAEVVSVSETLTVPAGTFSKCLRTEETTPLEPKTREYKVYAPGVGLVKDGALELVSWKKLMTAAGSRS
jgi:hypothetical protein